jgi:hypothetical protein
MDIYDGAEWTEMDIDDLKAEIAAGSSIEEAAQFLCRADTRLLFVRGAFVAISTGSIIQPLPVENHGQTHETGRQGGFRLFRRSKVGFCLAY